MRPSQKFFSSPAFSPLPLVVGCSVYSWCNFFFALMVYLITCLSLSLHVDKWRANFPWGFPACILNSILRGDDSESGKSGWVIPGRLVVFCVYYGGRSKPITVKANTLIWLGRKCYIGCKKKRDDIGRFMVNIRWWLTKDFSWRERYTNIMRNENTSNSLITKDPTTSTTCCCHPVTNQTRIHLWGTLIHDPTITIEGNKFLFTGFQPHRGWEHSCSELCSPTTSSTSLAPH